MTVGEEGRGPGIKRRWASSRPGESIGPSAQSDETFPSRGDAPSFADQRQRSYGTVTAAMQVFDEDERPPTGFRDRRGSGSAEKQADPSASVSDMVATSLALDSHSLLHSTFTPSRTRHSLLSYSTFTPLLLDFHSLSHLTSTSTCTDPGCPTQSS